jgi:hypothetical protein
MGPIRLAAGGQRASAMMIWSAATVVMSLWCWCSIKLSLVSRSRPIDGLRTDSHLANCQGTAEQASCRRGNGFPEPAAPRLRAAEGHCPNIHAKNAFKEEKPMLTTVINKPRALLCLLLVATFSAAGNAQADSKKWRANNHSDEYVRVFWTAAGCAGVKDNCRTGQVDYVCAVKELNQGEETHYKFNDGSSNRKKGVCALDTGGTWGGTSVSWTDHRKTNGIRCPDKNTCEWYDD